MADARTVLEEYVAAGKVMQLATLRADGSPVVCNLWFASAVGPDRLWFISRANREHCAQLRADPRVAGSIVPIVPDELGGRPVCGVTFTGTAAELPTTGVDREIAAYLARWPKAVTAIAPELLAGGRTHHRIYEIRVDGWVLFDEDRFAGAPRQPVEAS